MGSTLSAARLSAHQLDQFHGAASAVSEPIEPFLNAREGRWVLVLPSFSLIKMFPPCRSVLNSRMSRIPICRPEHSPIPINPICVHRAASSCHYTGWHAKLRTYYLISQRAQMSQINRQINQCSERPCGLVGFGTGGDLYSQASYSSASHQHLAQAPAAAYRLICCSHSILLSLGGDTHIVFIC